MNQHATLLPVVSDSESIDAPVADVLRRAMVIALEAARGASSRVECQQGFDGILVNVYHPALNKEEPKVLADIITAVTMSDLDMKIGEFHVAGELGVTMSFKLS